MSRLANTPGGNLTIPPELLSPPPRAVRVRPGHRPRLGRQWLLASPFILVGAIMLLYCIVDPFFVRLVPPTPATVVYLHPSERGTLNHVGYSYVLDGTQHTSDETVKDPLYSSMHIGQTIQIHAWEAGGLHYSEIERPDYVSNRLGFLVLALLWNGMLAWSGSPSEPSPADLFAPASP